MREFQNWMSRVSLDLTYIPPFSNRLREKLIHLMLPLPREHRGCINYIYPNSWSLGLWIYILYSDTGQQRTEIDWCAQGDVSGGVTIFGDIWTKHIQAAAAVDYLGYLERHRWGGRCLYGCDIYLQYMCTS